MKNKDFADRVFSMIIALALVLILSVSIGSYLDYGILGPIITLTVSALFIWGLTQ